MCLIHGTHANRGIENLKDATYVIGRLINDVECQNKCAVCKDHKSHAKNAEVSRIEYGKDCEE